MRYIKRLAEGMGFEPTIGVSTYNGLANPLRQPEKAAKLAKTQALRQRETRGKRGVERFADTHSGAQFVRAPFRVSRMEMAHG